MGRGSNAGGGQAKRSLDLWWVAQPHLVSRWRPRSRGYQLYVLAAVPLLLDAQSRHLYRQHRRYLRLGIQRDRHSPERFDVQGDEDREPEHEPRRQPALLARLDPDRARRIRPAFHLHDGIPAMKTFAARAGAQTSRSAPGRTPTRRYSFLMTLTYRPAAFRIRGTKSDCSRSTQR